MDPPLLVLASLLGVGLGFIAIAVYERAYPWIRAINELHIKAYPCWRVEKGILKAKCAEYITHRPYVKRKQLSEHLRRCLGKPTPNEEWSTKIVYGPRKSGKTFAVREVLKDQEAVIDVILTEGSMDELINEVLQKVYPKLITIGNKVPYNSRCERQDILKSALISLRNKKPRVVPTLLIKVTGNHAHRDYELSRTLPLLEQWVHKQNLANAIVVLSCTDLPKYDDKRAEVVSIGDLTVEETETYLRGTCDYKQLQGSEEEKTKLAKELAPITGGRLLDLKQLVDDVPKGGTLHDLEVLVHKQAEYLVTRNEVSLDEFLKLFERKFDHVLQNLLRNERVCLGEFDKCLKPESKDNYRNLRQDISKIWSQPFDINPETADVSIRSPFMRKAIEKYFSQASGSSK